MKILKIKNIGHNKRISYHHSMLAKRLKDDNHLDKVVEEIYSDSKNSLNFDCFEIIWKKFCCKSEILTFKNILYEKASKKIEYYFDTYTHFRKMQENDILKYLLLGNYLVNIFNFLTRPSISKLYSESDDIYQNIQKNREFNKEIQMEELNELIKSYNIKKNNSDELNKKLFYLFDYEIDNLLIG